MKSGAEEGTIHLPQRTTLIAVIALFCVATLSIYGPSLSNDFVRWDDDMLIYENPAIRAINPATLAWIFTHFDPELYIPLTFMSYQIDYLIGGANPAIYHFTNLVLHTFNALLAAWFLFLLTRKRWVALLIGALFAVHPLHAEAVMWASARKDVLSTFFFLLSIIGYVTYQSNGRRRPYVLSIAAFLLALMAKVTVVVLPLIFLLIDFRNRRRWGRAMLIEKIPYLGLALLFGVVAIVGKTTVLARATPSETVLMAGKSTVFYLEKILVPTKLSVLYPYVGDIVPSNPDFFVPWLIVLLLGISALWSLRRTQEIFFGLLLFFLATAPTFVNFAKGTLDVYFASDRYAYAGSIGILFLLALLLERIARLEWGPMRQRHATIAIAGTSVALCVSFASLAYAQSLTWKDTEALFSNVLRYYSDSHVAHNNIANVYRKKGDLEQAIEHYHRAIEIRSYARTISNLASAYRQLGRLEDARTLYEQALQIDQGTKQVHLGYGVLLAQEGRIEQALASYDKAIALDPLFAEAYLNRGALYASTGNYEQAMKEYRQAIAINPFPPQAHFNLGVALSKIGRMHEAMEAYEEAVAVAPTFVAARINLGIMYYDRKRIEDAVEQFEEVLKVDPENARARSALGQIQSRR